MFPQNNQKLRLLENPSKMVKINKTSQSKILQNLLLKETSVFLRTLIKLSWGSLAKSFPHERTTCKRSQQQKLKTLIARQTQWKCYTQQNLIIEIFAKGSVKYNQIISWNLNKAELRLARKVVSTQTNDLQKIPTTKIKDLDCQAKPMKMLHPTKPRNWNFCKRFC